MADTSFDVIIIGSGPGGYVTAIRAAQLGFKTAIVEKSYLGGICLNWGCIPTKALLRSAEIYHYMQHAKDYGLSAEKISYDPKAVVARSRGVSKRLNDGVGFLMKKNKVQIIWGDASIDAPGKLTVKKSAVEAPKGTLGEGAYHRKTHHHRDRRAAAGAAGAGARQETGLDLFRGDGAGEDAEIAAGGRLRRDRHGVRLVLPHHGRRSDGRRSAAADPAGGRRRDLRDSPTRRSRKQGIKILTNTKVTKLEKKSDSVIATIDDGKKPQAVEFDRVISAVGVVGNIENLGLEKLGVKTDRGCVVIDGYGKTNVPGIYAIGDVAGPPMLAHKAEHEGVICVEAIKGLHPHAMDKNLIPGCTYCHPQIASVGLTEAKAKEAGREIRVGRFPFVGNGKAIALGEDQGLVKVIFDKKTGQLLGAHMVGAEVTELIQGYVVAMNLETTEEELMHTIFPHPTLSEMMKEAVLDAYGRVLNM